MSITDRKTLERRAEQAGSAKRAPRQKKSKVKPTRPKAMTPVEENAADLHVPWDVPGSHLRAGNLDGRRVAPTLRGAPATTQSAELLTFGICGAPTSTDGVVIGLDCLSHAIVAHDVVTAYAAQLITSPTVLLLGDVGTGKSSLAKSVYVFRPLVLNHRRVVVIDKKDERGAGEYADLTRRFGAEPITFRLDGTGAILNPLDPAIAGKDLTLTDRLLVSLAELAANRSLTVWEAQALRVAMRAAKAKAEEDRKRTPVLADVASALGVALPKDRPLPKSALDEYVHSALTVRFMLEEFLDTYGVIFDGETSKHVRLADKLTTFDVSQLPNEGSAVPAVVGVAYSWLMGMLREDRGKATNLVLEEGWHIIDGPNAKAVRASTKLARGLGLSLVVALHKPSDIALGSPGMAIIQEAQTVHIYRNTRSDDVERVITLFDLDVNSRDLLMTLPRGQHLLKIASRPEIMVQHVRSAIEEQLTNTDSAMMAAGLR